jgi:GH24 family phage-related lysozyme (muramidase)
MAEKGTKENPYTSLEELKKSTAYYAGGKAVSEVEKRLNRRLTPEEKRIVELEGFVDAYYKDSKGVLTRGIGQTGAYAEGETSLSGFDKAYQEHLNRLKAREGMGMFDKYSPSLRQELVQAEYRGDLGQSPNFRKILAEAKTAEDYNKAADEFLRNQDYVKAKESGSGVASRMEAVADAVRREGAKLYGEPIQEPSFLENAYDKGLGAIRQLGFKKGGDVNNMITPMIDVSTDRLPYDRLQEMARRSMMLGNEQDRMEDYDDARRVAEKPNARSAYSTAAPMSMQAQRMMGFAEGGMVDDAQGLASLGRGGDSMLVHMQPQEVAGLQRLAEQSGTSLTKNPYTGMPEAFNLGGVFKAAAPIAAGYFTGGAGGALGAQLAAGAATGGALAALTGEDPIMGTVSGGMGGVSGGGLADFMGAGLPAATETAAATAPLSGVAGATSYNPALNSAAFNPMNPPVPVSGGMTAKQATSGLTTGGGFNTATGSVSQGGRLSFSDAFENPSNFFQTGKENMQLLANKEAMKTPFLVDEAGKASYGLPSEVTTLNAAMKLGSPIASLGMGGIEESDLMPSMDYLDDARERDKYDPTSQLDLGMDTGIAEALKRDSGLRLLAQGGYLDGGHIGDGMSDSVRANIDGQQQARLSEGEFVIPADVVSHLGNGSSDAGAQRLYSMMDRVRKARTGTEQQGREIDPRKYMPR